MAVARFLFWGELTGKGEGAMEAGLVRHGRRFRVLGLMVVGLWGLWASPALALTDLEIVKQNVLSFLTAEGANRADPFVSAALTNLNDKATTHLNTNNPDGSWSDLNYIQIPGASWGVGTHYVRIYVMAQAYRTQGQSLYGSPPLKLAIERALAYGHNYVYPGVVKAGNWWWWKIGVPKRLGPTLLLMQGDLDLVIFTNALGTLSYLIESAPGTGTSQNTIWTIMNHLSYALLINDPLWMQNKVLPSISSAVVITTGTATAGMQSDYSFHQHGPQLYTGGYGGEYAEDVAKYVLFTKGTSYQLPSANFDTFITYVAEGPRWALDHNYFDPSVVSREVTRAGERGSPGLAAMLMLSQVTSPLQNEFIAAAKQMLSSWNVTFSVEVSGLVTPVQSSTVPAAWPTGHKHFPRSDYSVHRRPTYYASVKMVSARSVSAELVNGEGLKSWFLSDGMTYIATRGNEYYTNNVWPTLDWTRLPGTTVEVKPRTGGGYGFGSRTFVGGAHTDAYGAAAMDFDATKYQKGADDWTRTDVVASPSCLMAKKSYFFFDDEVVALGSDITCPSANPVETVVAQWPLATATTPLYVDGIVKPSSPGWEETMPNITWAQANGMGYYFPGGQTIRGKRETRSGRWSDLNAGGSTTVYTNPILTLWYEHGTFAGGQTYRYAVLPGKTSEEMAGYAASLPLSILAHDGRVHAVKDNLLHAVGAVFWAADSVDLVTVDRPCVLFYITEGDILTLAVSDPTQASSTFHVTVNERLTPLALPEGVTATTTAASTVITYTARDGLNYLARFARVPTSAPTVSLSASPPSITTGQSSTLTWSSTNATSCTASGGWSGIKATAGSELVSPTQTTTYSLSCIGAGGSGSASVTVTVTSASDTTPPVISSVQATGITTSAATISWSTDEAATSQLEYGLTTGYGNTTPLEPTLVTSHAVTLSGLSPNTTYHYRVLSKDAAGNLATASDQMFTTAASLNQPPAGQTPWQTNAYGTLKTGLSKNDALGYHFTPQVPGQITQLGGFFNGTKIVKLFDKATGTLLASASVSAANTWSYSPIPPVPVSAGATYTVAVYLAGSGGSKRVDLSPPFPRTFGDVRIEGMTSIDTSTNPDARPINTETQKMLGQADVVFVPSGP